MSISDVDAQAVCISHYAPIANVIQMAHLANQQPGPWEIAKYRTGDVAMGGASRLHRTQMRHGDRALQCFHSTVGLPARSDVSFSLNEDPRYIRACRDHAFHDVLWGACGSAQHDFDIA